MSTRAQQKTLKCSTPHLDAACRFQLGENFSNHYLTQREFEVLKYILIGYTAKRIGKALDLSYRTVEAYVDTLKLKLGCHSKSAIIEVVIKSKLLDFNTL